MTNPDRNVDRWAAGVRLEIVAIIQPCHSGSGHPMDEENIFPVRGTGHDHQAAVPFAGNKEAWFLKLPSFDFVALDDVLDDRLAIVKFDEIAEADLAPVFVEQHRMPEL